jgi:hypothetical protein
MIRSNAIPIENILDFGDTVAFLCATCIKYSKCKDLKEFEEIIFCDYYKFEEENIYGNG